MIGHDVLHLSILLLPCNTNVVGIIRTPIWSLLFGTCGWRDGAERLYSGRSG